MQKSFTGINAASRAWLLARLQLEHPCMTIICSSRRSCEELSSDLKLFSNCQKILQLPAWDSLPFENVSPQTHLCAERVTALSTLASGKRI